MTKTIRVLFTKKEVGLLNGLLAKGQCIPDLIRDLTIESLDCREDKALSYLADCLDNKDIKLINHDDAWK